MKFKLVDRHALNLRVGDTALAIGRCNTVFQALQINLQHHHNVGMEADLLLHKGLGDRIVDGTVCLVSLNLSQVFIVLLDGGSSLGRNSNRTNRNDLVGVVFREVKQITHHIRLALQLLRLFRQGGACRNVSLPVAPGVDDIVATLEVNRYLFVILNVAHQEFDTIVDEFFSIVKHTLLVGDRLQVVNLH